ncbi:hypothetical protein [Oceanobacillus sp. CAU 1775]
MKKNIMSNSLVFKFLTVWLLMIIPLSNTSLYFIFHQVALNNELDQLKSKAEQITQTISNYSENMDDDQLTQLLRLLVPSNGIIQVIDQRQKSLMTIFRGNNINLTEKASFKERATSEIQTRDGVQYAVTNTPIIWRGGEVVTLKLTYKLESLQKNIEILKPILIIISLVLLISITPFIVLGRKILSSKTLDFPQTKE